MKRLIGVLAAAMLLVGMFAIPAMASHDGGDPPSTPDSNQASWWEDHFNDGSTCEKFDNPGDPFTVPAAPDGYEWTWLVVNSGQDDVAGQGGVRSYIVASPEAGVSYRNPGGTKGAGAGVSNAILCKGESEPENGNGNGENGNGENGNGENGDDPMTRVSFEKEWGGDEVSDVTVTFLFSIDGQDAVELNEGEWSEEFGTAASYELVGENISGLPEACEVTGTEVEQSSTSTDEDGLTSTVYTVTNTVECEPENGEPENGEPENGEPENGEPEEEDVPVPTVVEAGSGGTLPVTGMPAWVLTLMALGLLLMGGGALAYTRD